MLERATGKTSTTIARFSSIALSLVIAATFASGCYTVFRHPGPEVLLDYHGNRRACSDCHEDAYDFETDAFDPGDYGLGPYVLDPDWCDYYIRPWWIDDCCWWNPPPCAYDPPQYASPQAVTQPVEASTPHVWIDPGRREMTMPEIGGSTGSGGAGASGSSSDHSSKPAEEPAKPSQRSEDSQSSQSHRDPERREMTPNRQPN